MLIQTSKLHNLPDNWLTARAVQWMFSETVGNWWLTTFTSDGTPLFAANPKTFLPSGEDRALASSVCKYINKHAHNGGAWMAGFIDKDRPQQFYLLWKDSDGDIHIPIEFPQSLKELKENWKLDDFLYQADMAVHFWREERAKLELSRSQIETSLVRGH